MNKRVPLLGVMVAVAALNSCAFAGHYELAEGHPHLPHVSVNCSSDSTTGFTPGPGRQPFDRDFDPPSLSWDNQDYKYDPANWTYIWVADNDDIRDVPKPFELIENFDYKVDISATGNPIGSHSEARAGVYPAIPGPNIYLPYTTEFSVVGGYNPDKPNNTTDSANPAGTFSKSNGSKPATTNGTIAAMVGARVRTMAIAESNDYSASSSASVELTEKLPTFRLVP